MDNYSFKQLFRIILPSRKSSSLLILLGKRLTQVNNILSNIFKEISLFDSKSNKKLLINNNKKKVLVIINGNRLIGKSLCPTTLRLLKLKDTTEINYYFVNDPLSAIPVNISKQIYSNSKQLLFNFLRSGSLINSFENFWGEIIKKYRPDLIIGIMPNLALTKIAKKYNIKIADIQHGVINHNHDWYFERFQNVESVFYKFKPSHLLLWSEREGQIIREMINSSKDQKKESKLVIIGPNVNLVKNNPKRNKKFLNHILVTCSYGLKGFYNRDEYKQIDRYSLATKEFFDWMLQIKGYIIRFRLHPLAFNRRDAFNQKKGINYLSESNPKSLFHLSINNSLSDDLNWSDVHITLKGSCTIDAYYTRKVTLFLCPASRRWWHSSYNDYEGYVFKRDKYPSFEGLYSDAIIFQKKQNKFKIEQKTSEDPIQKEIKKIVS